MQGPGEEGGPRHWPCLQAEGALRASYAACCPDTGPDAKVAPSWSTCLSGVLAPNGFKHQVCTEIGGAIMRRGLPAVRGACGDPGLPTPNPGPALPDHIDRAAPEPQASWRGVNVPSVAAFKGGKQAVLLIPPCPSSPPLSPCAWDAKKHLASGAFQSSLSAPGLPGHSRGHHAGREPRVDVATATLCCRQKCLWGLVRKQESVPEEGKTPHSRHGQHLEPGAWSPKSGAGSPGARSQEPRARSQEP